MRSGVAIAALAGVLVAAPAAADSEERERRLTVAGRASSLSMDAFGSSSSTLAGGFGVALAYGLRSWLDLGVAGGYLVRNDVQFRDPDLVGVTGDDLDLYTNLHAIDAALTARVLGRSRILLRLRPLLEVRLGLAYRILASPKVFSSGLIAEPDSERTFHLLGGVRVGAAYRWTDHLQLGLLLGADVGAEYSTFGLNLELSWQYY